MSFFVNSIGEYFMGLLSGLGFKSRPARPLDLPAGHLWRSGSTLYFYDGATDIDLTTVPVTDHGALAGLTDNDHTQYQLKGSRVETSGDWTLSYDESTKKVTVSATAAGIYFDGVRTTLTLAAVESDAHPPTTGAYMFHVNAAGVVSYSAVSAFSLRSATLAPLVSVYYNATTGKGRALRETHDHLVGPVEHESMHLAGALYVRGFTIGGVTKDTAGSSAQQMTLSEGVMSDDGLLHTLSALAAGSYSMMWRSGSDSAGEWSWSTGATAPHLNTGTGTDIQYNMLSGGNWSVADITTNNRWVSYWVCAIPDLVSAYRITVIVGQAVHSSLASAMAENIANLNWGAMRFAAEIVPLYQLIFRRHSSLGDPGNCEIDEYTAIYGGRISVASAAASTPTVVSTFPDDIFELYNVTDTTKRIRFTLGGVTTGSTRILTPLDKDYTLEETGHASKHATGGGDALTPADIDAAAVADLGDGAYADFGTSAGDVAEGDHTHGSGAWATVGTNAARPATPTNIGDAYISNGTDGASDFDIGLLLA